jgi:hypothetical protein
MTRLRVRVALLTGLVVASAAAAARPAQACPCGNTVLATAATVGSPCCETPMRKVCVTEYVPETYVTTRTVFRTEQRLEKYTAYRTECFPETRSRTVTVNRIVPEWREEVRTVCVSVPTVEQRTVYKQVVSYHAETTVTCKTVDQGHWECREVPCGPSLSERFHKMCHRNDCCEPCEVRTKTERVWVPCKVTVEVPCTRMVRHCESVPTVVNVTVCRMVPQQQTFKVCVNRCVPETHVENYTVMVPRQVASEATRTVCVPVPVQENVTCTRLVARTVEKWVPAETCCTEAGYAPAAGGLFHRRGCCR